MLVARSRLTLASLLVVAAMTTTTMATTAAMAAEPDEARRTELYREGIADGDKGNWANAAKKFREVVAIRSAPKALIALAVAVEKTGHPAEARRLYVRALADSHTLGPSHGDEARAANEALTRLTPRVPRVTPVVPSDTPARTYTVDGEKLELQDGGLDLDVGAHSIDVESVDGKHFTKSVTLKEGDRLNFFVTFPAGAGGTAKTDPPNGGGGVTKPPKPDDTTKPPPSLPPSRREQESNVPIAPLVVAGAGVVTAGVGALLWALGKGDESSAKDDCGGQTTNCPRSVESTVDSAHTKVLVGNVVFIVGLAAIAGGAIWFFVTPRDSGGSSGGAHASSGATSQCRALVCF